MAIGPGKKKKTIEAKGKLYSNRNSKFMSPPSFNSAINMSYAIPATPFSLLLLFSHLSPLLCLSSFPAVDQIIEPLQLEVDYFFVEKFGFVLCIVETSIVLGFNVSIICTRVFFLCYWGSNKLEF